MATVTVATTISSDITTSTISLSNSSTLTKAGSSKGLDTSTGLARKTFKSASQADLITTSGFTAGAANKVYICNYGSSTTEYATIFIASLEIGRLYGGDWMFFPWNGDSNIRITPSVATEMIVDYMVIS